MNESLPTRLLLVLAEASPDKLAAVERFLAGKPFPGTERDAGSAWVFRWTGRDWKVGFAGGEPFYLLDMLGARYVDYLLHSPNVPITAFDLEVAVQPGKGEARSRDSTQPESDGQACHEYRQALRQLRAEREKAQAAGDRQALRGLGDEIRSFEAALKGSRMPDSGERAYDSVRQALRVFTEHLAKGGPQERAFAEHLHAHLSIGFECLYIHPEGRIWG